MSAACPVFGFAMSLRVAPAPHDADGHALWQSLVREAAGRRGLVCDGVRDGVRDARRWSCVVRSEAGQATDADREAMAAWAAAHPDVVGVEIGPLVDLAGAD